MTQITYLTGRNEILWNDYVQSHPDGTPFHLTHWRDAIELTFDHESYYLMARRGWEVVGVLPLFHVKSLLFGSMLVSVPFAVYGGGLADDRQTGEELESQAKRLADRLGVDYLELRDRQTPDTPHAANGVLYATFRKSLPKEPDKILPAIPRKTRRMVRLGIKGGLQGRLTRAASDVDSFYGLFAHNLRKLGTPAFPKSLLANLLSSFGQATDILLIEHGRTVVAGVLNFYFRDDVLPYYSGADEQFNSLGINNFLYFDLMTKSVERGYRLFDFGRSKIGTGPYDFKRHFGFEPQPLSYRHYLVRAQDPPNLNPTNPKYRKAIELWKKLPLWMTITVGPRIVRGIP